jgi:hypothetical protein
MSATEGSTLAAAMRGLTAKVVNGALEEIERAADREGPDPDGRHASLAYLNWLIDDAERWREVVMESIEDPPDVTGNPWPDCICNDARYELGHMESCPAYGRTPDAPAPDDLDR